MLVGPPGAGKSTVGRALSAALDLPFVDLDARVAADAGHDRVEALIEARGVDGFRQAESATLKQVLREQPQRAVIATGGGTFVDAANRASIAASGATTVWLDLPTDQSVDRLRRAPRAGLPTDEPALRALLDARRAAYALAERHIDARDHIAEQVRAIGARLPGAQRVRITPQAPEPPYDVRMLVGGIADAAEAIAQRAAEQRSTGALVICERRFAAACAVLIERLRARGQAVAAAPVVIAGGERAKTARGLQRLWRALGRADIDRGGLVIGVGGGACTDLVGMAAATWMRGTPAVLVPTTLLAMADASVGGKTAINLPGDEAAHGALRKNAVGVFAQPRLVVTPLRTLRTLPARQWRSGLAEVAKAWLLSGELAPSERWRLEGGLRDWRRAPEQLAGVLSAAIEVKAAVVAADSRERGARALLNLGHTVGHALEAASDGALLHGEAVAAGLRLEAQAAARLGWAEPGTVEHVREALTRFGLLGLAEAARWSDKAAEALGADKKRRGDRLVWPVLRAPGRAEIVDCALESLADAVAG